MYTCTYILPSTAHVACVQMSNVATGPNIARRLVLSEVAHVPEFARLVQVQVGRGSWARLAGPVGCQWVFRRLGETFPFLVNLAALPKLLFSPIPQVLTPWPVDAQFCPKHPPAAARVWRLSVAASSPFKDNCTTEPIATNDVNDTDNGQRASPFFWAL